MATRGDHPEEDPVDVVGAGAVAATEGAEAEGTKKMEVPGETTAMTT